MGLYPYIIYCDGSEQEATGDLTAKGYYVYDPSDNTIFVLDKWFADR